MWHNSYAICELSGFLTYKCAVWNEKLPDILKWKSGNFSLQSRLVCGVGKKWSGNFVS